VQKKKVRKKKLQLFFPPTKKNVITKKKYVKKFVCVLSACKLKYYMKNICPTTTRKKELKLPS